MPPFRGSARIDPASVFSVAILFVLISRMRHFFSYNVNQRLLPSEPLFPLNEPVIERQVALVLTDSGRWVPGVAHLTSERLVWEPALIPANRDVEFIELPFSAIESSRVQRRIKTYFFEPYLSLRAYDQELRLGFDTHFGWSACAYRWAEAINAAREGRIAREPTLLQTLRRVPVGLDLILALCIAVIALMIGTTGASFSTPRPLPLLVAAGALTIAFALLSRGRPSPRSGSQE